MLYKKTFICRNCGRCCSPVVNLDEDDISRITTAGISSDKFVDNVPVTPASSTARLRQLGGRCIFLEFKEGNKSYCRIYNARPKVCREYPFFNCSSIADCRPKFSVYEKTVKDAMELVKRRGFA